MFVSPVRWVISRSSSAVAVAVPGRDPHAGLGPAGGVDGHAGEQAVLLKVKSFWLMPEEAGGAVVGHEEVRPAVAVEIVRHHAQARAGLAADAGGERDVLEGAVPPVAEQAVRHRRKAEGPQ